MSYKDKFPVHLISSESDEDISAQSVSEFPKNQLSPKTTSVDDDDDDFLLLPLRERLLRMKNIKEKAKVCDLSSDDEVTIIEEKQTTFVNVAFKNDANICKPSTSNVHDKIIASKFSDINTFLQQDVDHQFNPLPDSPKTYNFMRKFSDSESLPDLDTTFSEQDQFQDILSVYGDENRTKSPVKHTKRTKRSKEEILAAKEQKLKEREEKLKIREKQLEMKAQEKKIKDMRKQEQKSLKPGECIKNVTVMIDLNLLEMAEAALISKELDESQMSSNLIEQITPNSITWSRKVFNQTLDGFKISHDLGTIEENQIVLIIPAIQFLNAVNNSKLGNCKYGGKNLLSIYRETKELNPTKRITFVTSGVEKYFSAQKSKEQRAYRQHVLKEDGSQTNNGSKRKQDNKLGFVITRLEVEEALIDLQLRESCNIYILSNADEVARLIVSITKSIAESQFKLGKIDNEMAWLISADTKDSVKVDKDGSGMQLLWQKQLQQLNMVSVDTAQAIIAQYPTPSSLIKAYKRCLNDQQRQQLLQDILVRRGIGPLSSTRRIGPELSRKIFVLLTSKNGDEMLDAYQC